jgi:hypothetical protein
VSLFHLSGKKKNYFALVLITVPSSDAHKQLEIKRFLDASADPSKQPPSKSDHLGPEAQESLRHLEELANQVNDTFKDVENKVEHSKRNILRNQKAYRGLR